MSVVYASNPYGQAAALIADLPARLAAHRSQHDLSITVQAKSIGISATSLTKLGPSSTQATVAKVLGWLGRIDIV